MLILLTKNLLPGLKMKMNQDNPGLSPFKMLLKKLI